MWHKIDNAPKDGTWIFIKGGREERVGSDYGDYPFPPAVCAYWDEFMDGWVYARFDMGCCVTCHEPTHWMPIPTA